MKDYHDWSSIQTVTPTLCTLLGISTPALSTTISLTDVLQDAQTVFSDSTIDRCLVFAPDALGNHLYSQYPTLFKDVINLAPIEVSVQSVMPSKTPVCFASMFTGATPDQHGIRKYEKPILHCDTLFDALVRANKRVAIVAVKNSSIDRIFRDRDIDYYSENYDFNVTERVISLLEVDQYHFILAYHQEYDDVMHATKPFAQEALQAAKNNITGFVQMAKAFDDSWSGYNRMIVFTPDHGAHITIERGKGDHGEDISEDMELTHFYGFRRSSCATSPRNVVW